MKKYIVSILAASVFLMGTPFVVPKAMASDISIRDFINLLIIIGVISPDKIPAANAFLATLDNNSTSTLAPNVSITANPTLINQYQDSTVTWSSMGANTCLVTGPAYGSSALSGSISTAVSGVLTPNSNLTYSISCTNSAGASNKSVTVNVTNSVSPYQMDSINPPTAPIGSTVTVLGSNFDQNATISLTGIGTIVPTNITPNTITFVVPATYLSTREGGPSVLTSTVGSTHAQVISKNGSNFSANSLSLNIISAVNTTAENASGIIKSVASNMTTGQNYIVIDYVTMNPNWQPGGNGGPAYTNLNTQTRSLEVSQNAKFIVNNTSSDKNSSTYSATTTITFSEFLNIFSAWSYVNGVKVSDYRANNPWDIVISNGVVTQITEHFLP